MTTHMEQAGLDERDVAYIIRRAHDAELFVARELVGVLRDDPFDRDGDVLLSTGEIINVKRVPFGFRFVNGGEMTTAPRTRCIVVEDDGEHFRLAGDVDPSRFSYGFPPVKRNPQRCWWVASGAVRRGTAEELRWPARADEEQS